MADALLRAAVTAQYAIAIAIAPYELPSFKPAAIGVSDFDLAVLRGRIDREGLLVRGYRFAGDTICRAARFETLSHELGKGFVGTTLPDSAGNPNGRKPPHSVFTTDLIDQAGSSPLMHTIDWPCRESIRLC